MEKIERDGLLIRAQSLGPFATNCYVIGCAETHEGAIIDSSNNADAIIAMVEASPALTITSLLQTHAHIDHVAALSEIAATYDVPLHIHRQEMELYRAAPAQGKMFNLTVPDLPAPDVYLEEGDEVTVGELTAEVLFTPGHTPGGICFYFEEQSVLFSGDLLFAGSIGRTDLPGGDFDTIKQSLERVAHLPDDTLVLSGHGPATNIGREKKINPFL